MENSITAETRQIIQQHLSLFLKQDLEALMKLYSEETVIVGYGKTYHGLKEIRTLMNECLKEWFGGDGVYSFDVTFEAFNGHHGYIEIKGSNHVHTIVFGNSDYYVANGKILYEAAGRYAVPKGQD